MYCVVDNDDGPGTFKFQGKAVNKSTRSSVIKYLGRIVGQFLSRTATMFRSKSVSRFLRRIADVVIDAHRSTRRSCWNFAWKRKGFIFFSQSKLEIKNLGSCHFTAMVTLLFKQKTFLRLTTQIYFAF